MDNIFILTLKAPIITAADDIPNIFLFIFKENKKIYILESRLQQTIHMKCQDLFSLKKIQCRLLQILLGGFRVKW